MNLIRRCLGAFADAFWLRQQLIADFDFLQDFRHGLRWLGKNLGFTAVAAFILALGIGANTAIFSIVNAVLLKPLPFKEPSRLVMVWERNYKRGRERNVVGPSNFVRWRERARSFEAMSAFLRFPLNVSGGEGEPERLPAGIATPEFFRILGVPAALGRTFLPEDGKPDAEPVIVLGYGLWQRRFGGAADVVGKKLTVNGRPRTIVGVMDASFEVPPEAELWATLTLDERARDSRGRSLLVVARLNAGVMPEEARAEMAAIAADIERERPDFNAGWGANVFPLQEDLTGNVRQALWVLLGAVSLVLLIACANVASLLLSRAAVREREFAIRTTLGAGRGRLAQLVLVESLSLGFLGGALGLAVAYVGLDALLAVLPAEIPSLVEIRVDPRVLAYTLLVSLASGILFGMAPALHAMRETSHAPLKEGGRTSGRSTRQRVRQALVISEIALALMLLVGAGLLMRSFFRLRSVDPGLNPRGLLTLQISLSGEKYQERHRLTEFYRQVLERFETVPGVVSAGAISWLPLGGPGSATSFTVNDRPAPAAGEEPVGEVRMVEGDLFRALGVPLLRGRAFDSRDSADSPKVVVVNQTLADLFWPGQDPLGKRISMSWGDDIEADIIGVVGDVRLTSLDAAPRSTLYWSQEQLGNSFMTFAVRARGNPLDLAGALRAQVHAVDPEQPVADLQTMEQVLARSLNRPRFTLVLLGLFASVALILAVVGIYGVVSYLVGQRTHEIGVRMALGARASDILRLVMGQGAWLAAVGVSLGLGGAFAATRYLESLLFDLPATDPLTFAGISLLLAGVALFACFVPARRATRVDPMTALHYE